MMRLLLRAAAVVVLLALAAPAVVAAYPERPIRLIISSAAGGSPSHALRKRPAAGDFRAHGIYGGTVELTDPDPADVAAVSAMLDRLPFDLLYARFDVVRFAGRLAVLELELIEPMLYLGLAPGSAGRLAEATIARLGSA